MSDRVARIEFHRFAGVIHRVVETRVLVVRQRQLDMRVRLLVGGATLYGILERIDRALGFAEVLLRGREFAARIGKRWRRAPARARELRPRADGCPGWLVVRRAENIVRGRVARIELDGGFECLDGFVVDRLPSALVRSRRGETAPADTARRWRSHARGQSEPLRDGCCARGSGQSVSRVRARRPV